MERDEDIAPKDSDTLFLLAASHYRQGELPAAEIQAQKILEQDPEHADTNHLLGLIAGQHGDYELACRFISCAIKNNPHQASYYNNLGHAMRGAGHLDEALAAYERATQLNPELVGTYNIRGQLLLELGQLEAALEVYDRVIQLNPELASSHYSSGYILKRLGRPEPARAALERAIELQPGFAPAYNVYGNVLMDLGRPDEALVAFQRAIQMDPGLAEAHYNLGLLYNDQGKNAEELDCYRKAIAINPGAAEPRWAQTMAQIPVIYARGVDPVLCRSRFSSELSGLIAWFDSNGIEEGYQSVGMQKPFYLAYQEENNRDLFARYGALCARLMEVWMDKQGFSDSGAVARKLPRVGIVSAQIRDHSVWNAFVKGWLQHIHRVEFQVFSIGSRQDEETGWAKSHAAYFAHGEKGLRQWVEIILDRKCDVLIYPEIGMDAITVKLASLRLAPVQVAAWGHPETTGFPTMDYYLSAQEFEPDHAQENYTEQLVTLPHLGCYYSPLPVDASEPDINGLGIDLTLPVFLCPGSPFKYLPEHDVVFVEIAKRTGRCQFVFFTHQTPGWSKKLAERLESVFTEAGLVYSDYVVFIPWQERSAFYGLMKRVDVFLDTIGFSGFNTAMQAVECRLPVVTREGRFMRGRLASGILQRMGLTELIAKNQEEYITLAVKLARDPAYRKHILQCMQANCYRLFEDMEPVRALEKFLLGVVDRS